MRSELTLRTTIDAPREHVWNRLDDLELMPQYEPFMEGLAYISTDPAAEGTAWRERNPLGITPAEDEWRVVESDPPHRRVYEGEATFVHARVVFELRPFDGRTRLKQVISYEFLPQLGPAGNVLDRLGFRRTLTHRQREHLETFGRVVEQEDDAQEA